MQTSVTFKNIDPSDHLRIFVEDKLGRFDRFLDNPAEASVVLSVEKFRHIAEVNIVGDRLSINGKEETDDMYSAIDMVIDKLESQIKKTKQKNRKHRTNAKRTKSKNQGYAFDSMAGPVGAAEPQVRVQNIEYKPMDVEEAVMQLNLVDDQFFVFTNSRTDRVNVLYRRKDGDFGLIQPSGS
jgi:putative sigma-54 modulation protein